MKLYRPLAVVLAALTLLAVPACNRGSSQPKVAFISNNAANFWTIAEAGCKAAAQRENVELLFYMPAPGTAAQQKEKIDTALSQGAKAIAISVIDPDNQQAFLNEVADQVPLLTQDNDAPDSKRLCYIGTDNYEAGKAVGRLVQETMPKGGKIAIFVGDRKPLNARQRMQGVLDQLADTRNAEPVKGKSYGPYELFDIYTDQPDGQKKAKENAVDALTLLEKEKQVCLIGLWEYNPPMILSAVKDKALERAKRGEIHIVGFDENSSTLEGISEGLVYGTVVQDPYLFGFESVRMMAEVARGDRGKVPRDGLYYIPYRVITREGGKDRIPVAKFREDLDRLLKKS
jgi:ribose transport system substrate-binding protein